MLLDCCVMNSMVYRARISNSGHIWEVGGNCCSNWAQLLKEKSRKWEQLTAAAAAAATTVDFLFCKLRPSKRVRARDGEHRVAGSGCHFCDGFVQMRNADERRRALNQSHNVNFYSPEEKEKKKNSKSLLGSGSFVGWRWRSLRYSTIIICPFFLLNEPVYINITVNIIPGWVDRNSVMASNEEAPSDDVSAERRWTLAPFSRANWRISWWSDETQIEVKPERRNREKLNHIHNILSIFDRSLLFVTPYITKLKGVHHHSVAHRGTQQEGKVFVVNSVGIYT